MDPVLIFFLLGALSFTIYLLLKKLNRYKSDDVGYRINPIYSIKYDDLGYRKNPIYRSSKTSILLIVDDYDLREPIAAHLAKCGLNVIQAMHFVRNPDLVEDKYKEILCEYSPDLIIIDGDAPYIHELTFWRYEVLPYQRKYKRISNIPLLLIERPEKEKNIFNFYNRDEIIYWPLNLAELYVRIKDLLRRTNKVSLNSNNHYEILNYGPLTLVPEKNEAIWFDPPENLNIWLNDLEFELLHCLLQMHGKTLSRAFIFKAVWGYEPDVINNVSVLVRGLRKKIEPDPRKPKYIKTVYGKGYCLLLD